jgi:signal transduction histidine kinase
MKLDDHQRALVTDLLLGVGIFIIGAASVIGFSPTESPDVRPPDVWAYALIGLQTLPLIWRRRFPVTVLTLTIAGFIVDRGLNYPGTLAAGGMAFAIYTIGAQLEPKRSLLMGGVAIDIVLGWTLVGVFVYDVEPLSLVTAAAFLGLPLLVGREAYHRQRRMVELEARAIRAEHEREQRAIEAVSNERRRISRELHDVVAHEITVMTLQAAGARRVIDEDKEKAAEAMESAEAAGHRALTEMRRLLGMLRTQDPRNMTPQPGLASLEALVEQMELAGLPIELSIKGTPEPLPAGLDLNVYRIIQESLTNTAKHGGPNVRARVSLTYDPGQLNVEVVDDGRGAAAWDQPGGGQGIVGMHERATLLKASLTAGPRSGGGYRVAAKIPIPA